MLHNYFNKIIKIALNYLFLEITIIFFEIKFQIKILNKIFIHNFMIYGLKITNLLQIKKNKY